MSTPKNGHLLTNERGGGEICLQKIDRGRRGRLGMCFFTVIRGTGRRISSKIERGLNLLSEFSSKGVKVPTWLNGKAFDQ